MDDESAEDINLWGQMDSQLEDLFTAVNVLDVKARHSASTSIQRWIRGYKVRKARRMKKSEPLPPVPPPAPAEPPAKKEPVKAEKVPSIFRSVHEADVGLMNNVYTPNIFAFHSAGVGGVLDDTSSFELRAAARLNARQQALDSREDGALWRQQRWEMREADSFLQAFHFSEAQDAFLPSRQQPHNFQYPQLWHAAPAPPSMPPRQPSMAPAWHRDLILPIR